MIRVKLVVERTEGEDQKPMRDIGFGVVAEITVFYFLILWFWVCWKNFRTLEFAIPRRRWWRPQFNARVLE